MAFRIMSTKMEWLDEEVRPATGEALLIPANDHLWMLGGPGLELKKVHGKEIELEAVRLGPLPAGGVGVTSGGPTGYRFLFHAVVAGQDQTWVEGSGREAARTAVAVTTREKLASLVAFPLYRGVHGKREEAAREMLQGFLEALQEPTSLRHLMVLYRGTEEKSLLHEIFLRLLDEQHR